MAANPDRAKITALRRELGLKRTELALKLGYCYAQVANVENGHGTPSEDYIGKLAAFYSRRLRRKITVADITAAEDEPEEKPAPSERRAPTPRPDIPRPVAPPRPSGPRRDAASGSDERIPA